MLKKLKERAKEASTWVSLGSIVGGLGMLLKADGVPEAGATIANSAAALAAGDYATPLALIVGGFLGAFLPERGGK